MDVLLVPLENRWAAAQMTHPRAKAAFLNEQSRRQEKVGE